MATNAIDDANSPIDSVPLPLPPKSTQKLFPTSSGTPKPTRKVIHTLQPLPQKPEVSKSWRNAAVVSNPVSVLEQHMALALPKTSSAVVPNNLTQDIQDPKSNDDEDSSSGSLSSVLAPPNVKMPKPTLQPSDDPMYLMLDIESCNPSMGPVLAIGGILASADRSGGHFRLHHRLLWVFSRDPTTYDAAGKSFWSRPDVVPIHTFFQQHHAQFPFSEQELVANFRGVLDECWRVYPKLIIMVDDPVTDCAMLCQLLWKYNCRPPNNDGNGKYRGQIYNSRDLMRGMFSMINPKFQNLNETDLYREIGEEWKSWKRKTGANVPRFEWAHCEPWDSKQYGPYLKHSPVYDSQHEVETYFQCFQLAAWKTGVGCPVGANALTNPALVLKASPLKKATIPTFHAFQSAGMVIPPHVQQHEWNYQPKPQAQPQPYLYSYSPIYYPSPTATDESLFSP